MSTHVRRTAAYGWTAFTIALLCTIGCGDDKPTGADGGDQDAAPPFDGGVDASQAMPDAGHDARVPPACTPSATSETQCGDGVDQDCDHAVDCLDPDCAEQSCGAGELACHAGGCLVPCTDADNCLPELPVIENVVARVRGDTLLVDFAAVSGARDYRIYPYPAQGTVLNGEDGALVVTDAIYRCSGDRPRPRRDRDGINLMSISLAGSIQSYTRTEAESLLGYVFITPGPGRDPVYRLGDPNRNGSYTWPYAAPPGMDYTGGDWVIGTAARDVLIASGWRDHGIAFYVQRDTGSNATRMLRRLEGEGTSVLFYVDGPEAEARGDGDERFSILAEPTDGAVPLYRIFYAFGADHDVLAAGDANRERVLSQGNVPLTTVTWPNMRGNTTYVIEALDQGCPFPGGLIGATSSPAEMGYGSTATTITLDEGRNDDTGEVFINGQHDVNNHPRPIARAYVTASPTAHPDMDWFVGFDQPLSEFQSMYVDGNGIRVLHNDVLSMEFASANVDHSFGAVLGQFVAGSSASFSISARGANAQISDDSYLHVTMSTDIPSTFRRYPQIFITDAPLDPPTFDLPVRVITHRLGPNTFEMLPPGDNHSILVQVFGPSPELQVQFCDRRGWGVSDQCPRANIYGFHAGSELTEWTAPWLPVPVLGEYVGVDRPVKFDVYASTSRVYVFVEDKPAGCAILPADRMPAGGVNVVFSAAGYHIDIDEFVEPENAMHEFWRRQSVAHVERRFDDLGIDTGVSLPPWDESVLPCGERFYE